MQRANKLPLLLVLYFAQGLPFGFQATALPILLRERGASLQAVGFSSLLALPWLLKPLWAPLVDRYGSARHGPRRSWIVAMQAALVVSALLAAQTDHLPTLAALVLAMNLFAATQDIAVDALAVSWLQSDQLGPANAAQVVGYKLGMLTGGGLLVWASGRIGWSGLFYTLAALMLAVLGVSRRIDEPRGPGAHAEAVDFRALSLHLRALTRSAEMLALVSVVVSYKAGEAIADAMWKPLLLDRGFSASELGLWAGSCGMALSLIGSSVAGFSIRKVSLARALLWISLLRAFGVLGEWWTSHLEDSSRTLVIAVTCAEHLFGGALTTVMFALMMSKTNPRIGGTHYALLASLEVLGKMPLAALSGVLAAQVGYESTFAIASALSFAFSGLVLLVGRHLGSAEPSDARA